MPLFYIIEDNDNQMKQIVHHNANKHLQYGYKLLINKLCNDLVVDDSCNLEHNKADLINFLLECYNGNIYINGLSHFLTEFENKYNIKYIIHKEKADLFDQFYLKLSMNVNDCNRFHEYQPLKYQNIIFGKINL
jgi:hypothetical protein